MSTERVRECFSRIGIEDRIMEFEASGATVELATGTVGRAPERIAKIL